MVNTLPSEQKNRKKETGNKGAQNRRIKTLWEKATSFGR
jgi:hypothetical protein